MRTPISWDCGKLIEYFECLHGYQHNITQQKNDIKLLPTSGQLPNHDFVVLIDENFNNHILIQVEFLEIVEAQLWSSQKTNNFLNSFFVFYKSNVFTTVFLEIIMISKLRMLLFKNKPQLYF